MRISDWSSRVLFRSVVHVDAEHLPQFGHVIVVERTAEQDRRRRQQRRMAAGLRRVLVAELGPRLADRPGDQEQPALLPFPAYRRLTIADPLPFAHVYGFAPFLLLYTVPPHRRPRQG